MSDESRQEKKPGTRQERVRRFRESALKTLVKINTNIKTAARYTSILSSMGENPGVRTYMNAAAGVIEHSTEYLLKKTFDPEKAHTVRFMGCLADKDVKEAVLEHAEVLETNPYNHHKHVKIGDRTIHVPSETSDRNISCVGKEDLPYVYAGIARILWEASPGVITLTAPPDYSSHWRMVYKEGVEALPSQRADKLGTLINRYLDNGIKRSILLYGKPGTGKTNTAYYVALKLFKRVLIINATYRMDSASVHSIVKDLSPEAVIINELDKTSYSGSLLEGIEFINKNVKLLIATANTCELPAALIRPGRFDELIYEDGIDRDVLDKLIKFECSEKLREEISKWPVAFLAELNKRVLVEQNRLDYHLKVMRERVSFNDETKIRGKKEKPEKTISAPRAMTYEDIEADADNTPDLDDDDPRGIEAKSAEGEE